MDILSIRKRAKERAEVSGPRAAAPAPSPPPPYRSLRDEIVVLDEPPPRHHDDDGNQPRARAPMNTSFARVRSEEIIPVPPPVSPRDADPLGEFLARYDASEEASNDVEEMAPAVVEESKRFLSFDLAGEVYAASIMDVREILKIVALTHVPRAPRDVLGVLSKRGIVMPVVDLAASIGLRMPDPDPQPEQRILVVGDGERVCGLRVDRVREVVRLATSTIEDVPATLGSRSAHMLVGLGRAGERMLILLDINQVLETLALAMGLSPREEQVP
jgi:purine-binding chemotaxis protein CheW